MGQVLCPEKRQEKHRGTGVHRSTHPQGQGEQGGMTHPHTTDTAPRRHTTGRAGKAQGAPQDRGAQHHTEAQHTEESTREYTRVHRGVL